MQRVLRVYPSPTLLGVRPPRPVDGPASPSHISKSSFVRSFGAGLFTAWADPDYGWESNVSGEAAF